MGQKPTKTSNNQNDLNLNTNKNADDLDLFVDVEASTEFEKLPKIILNHIFSFLSIFELVQLSTINKFLFNLIFNKKNLTSKTIWQLKCKRIVGEEEELLKELIENRKWSKYETNFNQFYLFLKHHLSFENLDNLLVQYQFKDNKYTITYTGKFAFFHSLKSKLILKQFAFF